MEDSLKTKTVIDRIKRAYIAHCRASHVDDETGVILYIGTDDIPRSVGINFDELGSILLRIEEDPVYAGIIVLEAIDVQPRKGDHPKRDCYRITANQGLVPRGVSHEKKPKVMLSRGWWCISIPGKQAVKVAKEGTLSGELLGVLGMSWGVPRTAESVYARLHERVKNRATERPTPTQLENAIREINKKLTAKEYRRIRLITKPDTIYGTWKYSLSLEPLPSPVGSLKPENPPFLNKRRKARK